MKRRISYVTAALTGFCLIFWANTGNLLAAPVPDSFNKANSQAKMSDKAPAASSDQDVQEEKSQRFKEIEWIIKLRLMQQYEKLAVNDDLEDGLD